MATNPIIISRRQNLWGRIIAQLSRDLGAWLYVAVVLGLVSVLAFAYLAQASYVARQIDLMAKLEGDLDVLHEENGMLLLRIAKVEDMSRIKAEARAMGLGEATHIEYVVVVLDDPQPAAQGPPATLNPRRSGTPFAPGGEDPTGDARSSQSLANGATVVRSSVPREGEDAPAPEGPRLVSAIAQQFQRWISGGTAGRVGGTLSSQSGTDARSSQPNW